MEQRRSNPTDEVTRSIGRRSADSVWRWVTTFLAGVLLTGIISMLTLWSAYAKDAVTRNELTKTIEELRVEIQDKDRHIADEHRMMFDKIQQMELDLNTVRVQTGLDPVRLPRRGNRTDTSEH